MRGTIGPAGTNGERTPVLVEQVAVLNDGPVKGHLAIGGRRIGTIRSASGWGCQRGAARSVASWNGLPRVVGVRLGIAPRLEIPVVVRRRLSVGNPRSEEHTSELQSH